MPRSLFILAALAGISAVGVAVADDTDFLPPNGYYASANGSGATLQSQLQSIISSGHIQRSYGDFRNSAAIHDQDPNNPSNILLVYNRASVGSNWTSGTTWNREHVWPQSRQPGSVSNSSRGNLGDPHALRPANPNINNSRGNKPFGTPTSTGNFGSAGSYYFPGDSDKGDVSRSLFYSATRYTGLSLTSGTLGSNQMGDLDALMVYHFDDVPDDFERRRNQAIYSQGLNPSYYTNNRNPYVDHPEFAWSVFVDNENDSTITLAGGSASADGSSVQSIDFGRAYVEEATPSLTQSITLDKAGQDGTYYEVTTVGPTTSDITGRFNAFRTGGTDSTTFNVGLNASTATPGVQGGTVIIDNLDVTNGSGMGDGAQDGNDLVLMSLSVLNHPVASFADSGDLRSATLDFGQLSLGAPTVDLGFEITNLLTGGPTFAADLDLDSVVATSGDTGAFLIDPMTFGGLAQGATESGVATALTAAAGVYEATYTLNLSGEDLPGEETQTLALTLRSEVVSAGPLPGDFNGDGVVDNGDLNLLLPNWGASTSPLPSGWVGDPPIGAIVDNDELNRLLPNWGAGIDAVPEPTTAAVLVLSLATVGCVRRR
ncbi:MAG: endonuclease [Planctomycetota bacterium]